MTSDIDFAFDYSYSFKTGEYEELAIEIKNIPLEAFVAVRGEDYDDDDDFESLNGLPDAKKIELINSTSLFLLDLSPFKNEINVSLINKNEDDKKLTLEEAKKIADNVRVNLDKKYNLNMNFVDYCDLCAEGVEKILTSNNYICEIKNEYYIHKYEGEKLQTYGHCWVECDGIIIDPSRDQFDNNDFAIKKELNKNYTSNKTLPKKKNGLKFK